MDAVWIKESVERLDDGREELKLAPALEHQPDLEVILRYRPLFDRAIGQDDAKRPEVLAAGEELVKFIENIPDFIWQAIENLSALASEEILKTTDFDAVTPEDFIGGEE